MASGSATKTPLRLNQRVWNSKSYQRMASELAYNTLAIS